MSTERMMAPIGSMNHLREPGSVQTVYGTTVDLHYFASQYGRHETKSIDEEIIPVIFPQDTNLAVLVPESPAVQEQTQLRCEGYPDCDDGRHMELGIVGLRCQFSNRFDNQDKGYCCHEETESDIAGSLQTSFARWKPTRVNSVDGTVAKNESKVAVRDSQHASNAFVPHMMNLPARIKDCICHGREQR